MLNLPPLILYYDGLCILCAKEMDIYRKQDQQNKLVFVDIAHPSFKDEHLKIERKTLHKHFHARVENEQTLYVGVEAFIEIWKRLPYWKKLVPLANFPPFLFILKQLYKVFVVVRPYLPRKKGCDNGQCDL